MYSLFSTTPRLLTSSIVAPRFVDVERKIVHDIDKITNHYRGNEYASRGDHLLVKLIQIMNVPLHYPLDRYYDVCLDRTNTVANSLRLTTSANQGQLFKGIFYHGCTEIIIVSNQINRPTELESGWRDLQAVKVIEHPVSNMRYMLPNGVNHNTERGLAVIHIDAAALMVQYRCFIQEQLTSSGGLNSNVLDERHFLYRYVFPNMLKSQTDIVIINRLFNLDSGAPMGDSIRRHVFYTSDYTEMLDKGLLYLLDRLKVTKMPYQTLLANIPRVFSDRPLSMPDMAETRQVYWALWLARVRAMKLLIDMAGDQGSHYNQTLLNELWIDLKRFRSDNIFKNTLPADIFYQYDPIIQELWSLSRGFN